MQDLRPSEQLKSVGCVERRYTHYIVASSCQHRCRGKVMGFASAQPILRTVGHAPTTTRRRSTDLPDGRSGASQAPRVRPAGLKFALT
jgi:hypothetical protein